MLIIVWTGLGLLVVPLLMGVGIVGAILLENLIGPVGMPVGLAIGTILLVVLGRAMNRDYNEHSLYGIPVQHWAWIQGFFTVFSVVLILLS